MDFDFSNIKLIVGLGNVGRDYEKTRHNAGFLVLDELHRQFPFSNWNHSNKLHAEIAKLGDLRLAKPDTMMNASGRSTKAIIDYFDITPEQVLVAHDDLDIPIGKSKVHMGRGPKQHNGILSIEKHLGTVNFWRLRIGIENRDQVGNSGIPGIKYSLQRFQEEELTEMYSAWDKFLEHQVEGKIQQHEIDLVE